METRRAHPRRAVKVAVTLVLPDGPVAAETRDLSVGGAFIVTSASVAHGSLLHLHVHAPMIGEETAVEATVRWTAPDGIGVQFKALRAIQTWAIQKVVRASLAGAGSGP